MLMRSPQSSQFMPLYFQMHAIITLRLRCLLKMYRHEKKSRSAVQHRLFSTFNNNTLPWMLGVFKTRNAESGNPMQPECLQYMCCACTCSCACTTDGMMEGSLPSPWNYAVHRFLSSKVHVWADIWRFPSRLCAPLPPQHLQRLRLFSALLATACSNSTQTVYTSPLPSF